MYNTNKRGKTPGEQQTTTKTRISETGTKDNGGNERQYEGKERQNRRYEETLTTPKTRTPK